MSDAKIRKANIEAHAMVQQHTPLDREAITNFIDKNYMALGIKQGLHLEFFPSPAAFYAAVNAEREAHGLEPTYRIPTWIHGIRELDVHMFWRDEIEEKKQHGTESEKRFKALAALASMSYPIYLFENEMCFVERPVKHHWDEVQPAGDVPTVRHRGDGPAIEFSDGTGLYYWHGTEVPSWAIESTHSLFSGLDTEGISQKRIELALDHDNAEVRRAVLEIVGYDKALAHAAVIDDNPDYGTLYEIGGLRLLKVINGSPEADGTYREYILLARPPQIAPESTVLQEIAAGYGVDVETYLSAACRT